MQNYPDGRRYEGFYKFDKRHGFGIYMMPDLSTYSGTWYEGKQHGYGCVYFMKNDVQELKYGLYLRGTKFFKLSKSQASDIQEGDFVVENTKLIEQALGADKLTFFDEIRQLSNKFEPFDNFATEQSVFELNKCT